MPFGLENFLEQLPVELADEDVEVEDTARGLGEGLLVGEGAPANVVGGEDGIRAKGDNGICPADFLR